MLFLLYVHLAHLLLILRLYVDMGDILVVCMIDCCMTTSVVTPEPGPTRLAGPNRNLGDARLILFIYILLRFIFQKCRDQNPRLDSKGESEPEPGLLRRFQLSYQNIFFVISL